MPECLYCGYRYQFPRTENPKKCPHCGNPLGKSPVRALWGRITTGKDE